jgi:putative ABC transport system substrate-binding protein
MYSAHFNRREFISLLGAATVSPLAASAQPAPKRSLIAWMTGVTRATSSPYFASFLKGMRDLNYIEGRDFEMIYRFSDGHADRLPVIGEEIVRANPDVIVAAAVDAVVAVRKYTSTIPIVSFALADAVHLGLIKSEARPAGNITGIQPYLQGLPAKQLELALEIVPHATKIGLLTNLQDPKAPPQAQQVRAAAQGLKLNVIAADASQPEEIEQALQAISSAEVDVVIVLQTSMLFSGRDQIAATALARKLPTVFGYEPHVVAGGLVSYGR